MAEKGAVAEAKSALRRGLRDARALDHATQPDAGNLLGMHFPDWLRPASGDFVASYRPIGTEIDPRPLEAVLRARGALLALPRIASITDRLHLDFHEWHGDDALITGPLGITEPRESTPLVRPVLVLTPLLGFDRKGGRLGYGKGYYDATLRVLKESGPPPFALGLAFAGQEVTEIPVDSHDQRLDGVLTPAEYIACAQ